MRASVTIAVAAMGLLGDATTSRAQVADVVTTGPTSDPLPTTSLLTVGAGAVALGTGATLLVAAPSERRCGELGGCLPASSRGAQTDAGAVLTGAGTGLVAVGALGWLLTEQAPLLRGERRDVPALATSGLVTVGLGVGAVGAGLGLGFTGIDGFDAGRAAPWLVAGGALVGVGVPLTLAGAAREDHAEREAERIDDEHGRRVAAARARAREEKRREADTIEDRLERGELERRRRNPALVATGAVLLGIGGLATVGCGLAATADDSRGWDALGSELGYIAGASVGGLIAVGGGVMMAVGAQTDLVETGRSNALVPREVRVGPTSASATWSF